MIEIISPAGFENFFRELSDSTVRGDIDLSVIEGLGERYALSYVQPDWLPDVVARYGLSYPPQGQ
jgi:hypothetical protein